MGKVLESIVLFVCCAVPVVVGVWVIYRKRQAWRRRSAFPFPEVRRRPAGEWCRRAAAGLNDEVSDYLGLLTVVPFLAWACLGHVQAQGWAARALGFAMAGCVCGFVCWRSLGLLRKRDDHELGYAGERYVAEEMVELVKDGFDVFHDVPFDGWNVDHVVVGPPGVFAVETKTRRKPVKGDGRKEYRVEFDGTQLRWPMGEDRGSIEQARRTARQVSEWLSGAVGESVSVMPIVTVPGWMVDQTVARPSVTVLNPKQIARYCTRETGRLSEKLQRQICFQLEQKCKLKTDE